ncbi:MAG: dTDP-4-dehydrorhamnose reductase [Dehalococcoidia bacterium]
MRILITGAGGQLAGELTRALEGHDLVPLAHRQLDVTDRVKVRTIVRCAAPDVVINTAAFHRVDDCELEPERAFAVNALGARNLALSCAEVDAALLHVSTDYVFGGDKGTPYREEDIARPLSAYGVSKLAGELFVRTILPRHYVVRTAGLFGSGTSGKGGNFVTTMLRLAADGRDITVVDDQRLSPTSARHLAAKLAWLVGAEAYGLYHVTNAGDCSWYELARAVFEEAGMSPRLTPTTTEAFGARARRPACSVLARGTLERLGADDLPHWREALREYLVDSGVREDDRQPAAYGR